jgi:hypothetical protein
MASNRGSGRNHDDDDDPISMVDDLERDLYDNDSDSAEERSSDLFVRRVREHERQRAKDRERSSASWRDQPKSQDTRGARPPADAKPSEPAQSQGQGRIQYYRALQGFLQAMTEAAPLYLGERRRNPQFSDEELKQAVAQKCKEHLSLVDMCLTANNADSQDILLRYMRRALAKNLAALYADTPIEALKGLVEVAQQWVLDSTDFENTMNETATGDSTLVIKLALFTATLKTQQRLDGLWCGHEPKEVLKELSKIALHLAKDVAYSWSKRSQISDKENLFSSALPYCLDAAEKAYRECVMDELEPIEYLPSDPAMPLPLFENSFESLGMGYEDETAQALIDRVRKIAMGYLDGAKIPDLLPDESAKWKSNFLAHIDGQMSEAWEDAGADLIDEIDAMEESEKESYLATHEYMDFSRFDTKLKDRLNEGNLPLQDITLSFDRIKDKAKHHLAWIWAISDSLIMSRSEQLPED